MPTTPPTREEVRAQLSKSLEGLPDHATVVNAVEDLAAAGVTTSDKRFSISFDGAEPKLYCEHTVAALRAKLDAAASAQPNSTQPLKPLPIA